MIRVGLHFVCPRAPEAVVLGDKEIIRVSDRSEDKHASQGGFFVIHNHFIIIMLSAYGNPTSLYLSRRIEQLCFQYRG